MIMRIFATLFAVNLFTVGGGYVMLPILHGYFVERYGWLTNQEFLDAVALGQVTPGPLTIMNVFIGYKLAGVPGSVAGALGTYLPSLLVVSLVSGYYSRYRDSAAVDAVLRGLKPAVAGMLAGVAVMLGGGVAGVSGVFIFAGCFALMAFTKADPTLVIIGSGVLGALLL
jgi:chromate transporter